jgi:hypothetical protein
MNPSRSTTGTWRRPAGKTTINWKHRQSRFLHLVLAIEKSPVFTQCSAQLANGAQMEHTKQETKSPLGFPLSDEFEY